MELRPRAVAIALAIEGCRSVREDDLQTWEGAPVAELDTHPLFLTMPVVQTVAADGTEIRDYVNGRNIGGGPALEEDQYSPRRLTWRPTIS